jgi:hypothetical protein
MDHSVELVVLVVLVLALVKALMNPCTYYSP